jgi:antitoxin HicB
MATLSYTVLLVPDPDRGGFTVTVPEIPEIVTEGDDQEHALAMAREAIALSLRYAAEKGLPVPVEREAPRLGLVEVEVDGAPREATAIAGVAG